MYIGCFTWFQIRSHVVPTATHTASPWPVLRTSRKRQRLSLHNLRTHTGTGWGFDSVCASHRSATRVVRGRFSHVSELLARTERAGKAAADDLLGANCIAIRTRSLIAQGQFAAATKESMRTPGAVTPSMHGELIASRAIALACERADSRALTTAEAASATTSAVEARVGSAATRAIVAVNRAQPEVFALAREAFDAARTLHSVEVFIAAYRGAPHLAQVLLDSEETREQMLAVLSLADDLDLFRTALSGESDHGTWQQLSRREREVLALVASGMSNREIGRTLFIAEATVKAHISHIFDKLVCLHERLQHFESPLMRGLRSIKLMNAKRRSVHDLEVLSLPHPITLVRPGEDGFKCCHNRRVELRLDSLSETHSRHTTGHGVTVRPIRRHRVVRICNRDDPRQKRDFLALEPVRISGPVDALMVMSNDLRYFRVGLNPR